MGMNEMMLPVIVLLPFAAGVLVSLLPFKSRKAMLIFIETAVLINSILVWMILLNRPEGTFTMLKFSGNLSVTFHIDGLAMVFAGLVALLWPLATLYSFEYMKHENHEKIFFTFYVITYGVTLGIATSANILSMYFFYELLTLVTVPLVLHTLKREAVLAARTYLYYSIGGAAFAFIGMIFVIIYGSTTDFVYGGVMGGNLYTGNENLLLFIYVLAFMGFGVKAAVCPFCAWLPQAGVAPTPVTALLHAVAVVKSGAFAIMRLTYYSFGTDFLKGTWAQYAVMGVTVFTIVFGCSMAVKERHIKRRLAYSTISNLSYILFGVTIMTPLGLVGALTHMVCHAVMKICSFFCAGAVMYKTEKCYVYELDGLGKKMPKTFGIFTVSALALMGVPGLCGFISKFNLAKAAVESRNTLAYVGIGALLASAVLTAIYMMGMIVRAYFPKQDFDYDAIEGIKDPDWMMLVPLFLFVAGIVVLGLYPTPLLELFGKIAAGII